MRMGGKNQKSVWWNDEVKVTVRRKEAVGRRGWQLAMKRQRKEVWKLTNKKRETLKRLYIRAKRKYE